MRRHVRLSAEGRGGMAQPRHEGEGVSEIARRTSRYKPAVSREPAGNGRGGRCGAAAAQAQGRGKELAARADVTARLGGARFYFCRPHSPWQKGTAENANGLIRELFPKGTDFSRVTGEEVEGAFALIDGRPRRVLGCGTAGEAHREELLHSA